MTITTHPESAPAAASRRDRSGSGLAAEAGEATSDDPYSPGLLTLLDALGGLIGVMAVLLPLTTVLVARPPSPDPPRLHGSEPSAGIPSARAREPRGGDPRRFTQ